MQRFQFSKPDHDLLVRRVAGALLEGALRPGDVDGLTDRQIQARLARSTLTAGDKRPTSPAPV